MAMSVSNDNPSKPSSSTSNLASTKELMILYERGKSYLLETRVVVKSSYAKLLKDKFTRLFSEEGASISTQQEQFFSVLRSAIDFDRGCIETVCLQFVVYQDGGVEEDSSHTDKVYAKIEEFLMSLPQTMHEQVTFTSLHPWLLAEVCEKSYRMLGLYLSYLVLLIRNLTSSIAENTAITGAQSLDESSAESTSSHPYRHLDQCRLRMLHLVNRSSRLRVCCSEVISCLANRMALEDAHAKALLLDAFSFCL